MDPAHLNYYTSVARLNAEFADWVQMQVRKDKSVCLKQGIKDYTYKLEKLEKETGVCVGKPFRCSLYMLNHPRQAYCLWMELGGLDDNLHGFSILQEMDQSLR